MRQKLYEKIEEENNTFVKNNDTPKNCLCYYTKQQKRAIKLQLAFDVKHLLEAIDTTPR